MVHKIDYAYHVLGLRQALIIKNLQRHEDTLVYDGCPSPRAKRQCIARKVTGQLLISPSTPDKLTLKKRVCKR